jgi:hypothetical protein
VTRQDAQRRAPHNEFERRLAAPFDDGMQTGAHDVNGNSCTGNGLKVLLQTPDSVLNAYDTHCVCSTLLVCTYYLGKAEAAHVAISAVLGLHTHAAHR